MHTIRTLPHELYVAFSGGVDSVVLAHLAQSLKRRVTLAFFHHGNAFADEEAKFVHAFASTHGFDVISAQTTEQAPPGLSREKFWRDQRYAWFKELEQEMPVAMGHHLDDAVEWYVMSAMHGEGYFIPYQNGNIIRPLIIQKKQHILDYAAAKGLTWLEDPSNNDTTFAVRNYVRHVLLPNCLKVNPGLYTVVRKRIMDKMAAL